MTVHDRESERLEALYDGISASGLAPLWPMKTTLMPETPRPKAVPWLWRYALVLELAAEAGEIIPIDRGGDRRVLSLANPGLDGLPFASSTLWGAIQYLNPGEHAPAHRHSPSAIRFVLEGRGVHTTVDGDACHMSPGDLVLTPSMSWHDHNSSADTPMVWFDGLDMPLVLALDAIFFENFPNDLPQPVVTEDRSRRIFTASGLLPADRVGRPAPHSQKLVYPWADTDAALTALLAELGGPMVTLEFCDPVTGRSALPTLGCRMHRLVPDERTHTTRRAGSSVYVVHRGAGTTIIDGQRFEWTTGDMFVVPSWAPVDHEANEPSDLFSIDDTPVLRALGLYREEVDETQQEITGAFEAVAGTTGHGA